MEEWRFCLSGRVCLCLGARAPRLLVRDVRDCSFVNGEVYQSANTFPISIEHFL